MGYTNSSLVSYTLLSPNHSGQRTHSIDTITPHCVVGQCSIESLGNVFIKPSRQASSNYGIGVDGRVGLFVEEKNRSWCSSSAVNDQRAITIECASDNFAPYAFKDVVYNRLVELCADICKRNGKDTIVWIADKNQRKAYEPKSNEMKFTWHCDWASTSCPGPWLKERMQDLTNKVNALLKGSAPAPTPEPTPQPQPQPTPVPVPQPQTDEEVIWYYLLTKIQNPYGVAGLMGNLYAESGLRSNNLQNTYERSLGMTDVQYTAAVDNGTYGNFIHDSAGYGLAQWTFWSRKQGMLNFIRGKKKSIGDLNAQLDFLWQELSTGYKGVLAVLTSAKSVRQASDAVLTQFERPADQSENMKQKRASYGQVYYDRYAGSSPAPSPTPQPTPTPSPTPSGVPYIVRITANVLNVRSGPGTNYPVVRTVKKGEAYTIVEEQNGWGKLKSGVGWISLTYTERV